MEVCSYWSRQLFASYSKQLLGLGNACAIENGVSHLSSACKKSLLLQFSRSNREQYMAYTGQTYVLLASKFTRPVARSWQCKYRDFILRSTTKQHNIVETLVY